MNRVQSVAMVIGGVLLASTASADVKKQERSLVKFEGLLGSAVNLFGGKAAKEGIVNTVAVKGDRKLTMSDYGGEIVDLKEEKVYRLDPKSKTYEVVTFAQIRREREEARQKAEKDAPRGDGRDDRGKPADGQPRKEVEVDFDVKQTGERKTVNGFDTRQAIMTIAVREKGRTLEQGGGMVLRSDMWLAPRAASQNEVAEFDLRYAQKIEGSTAIAAAQAQMAMAMATYPQMGEALKRFQAEGTRLEGTPIVMTTVLEAVKSADQAADAPKQEEQASGLGGMLGRKLGKKLGTSEKPGSPGRATIMTINNEVLSLTTSVVAGDVALPAGYRPK